VTLFLLLGLAASEYAFVQQRFPAHVPTIALFFSASLLFFLLLTEAGVILLAFSLPFVFRSTHLIVRAYASRNVHLLLFAVVTGALCFFFQLAYLSVLMFKQVPFLGWVFGGKPALYQCFLVTPLLTALAFHHFTAAKGGEGLSAEAKGEVRVMFKAKMAVRARERAHTASGEQRATE
jgi:hypothetical protein